MAQVFAGRDSVPDKLFELLDLRKPPFIRAGPDDLNAKAHFEYTPVPGIRATSPILLWNVVKSSGAIQAARKSQRHCVQYVISIRGVLAVTLWGA